MSSFCIYHPDQSVNIGHFLTPQISFSLRGSLHGFSSTDFGRPHSRLRSRMPPPQETLQGVQSDHGPRTIIKKSSQKKISNHKILLYEFLPGHFFSLHFSTSVSFPGQIRISEVDPSGSVHFLDLSLLPPPHVTLHSPQDDQVVHDGQTFVLQIC